MPINIRLGEHDMIAFDPEGQGSVTLSPASARRVYDLLEHQYHREDAERHVEDWLDAFSMGVEDIPGCPDAGFDEELEYMAEQFEHDKDCNTADNYVWESIVENIMRPFLFKRIVDTLAEAEYEPCDLEAAADAAENIDVRELCLDNDDEKIPGRDIAAILKLGCAKERKASLRTVFSEDRDWSVLFRFYTCAESAKADRLAKS